MNESIHVSILLFTFLYFLNDECLHVCNNKVRENESGRGVDDDNGETPELLARNKTHVVH